MLFFLVSISCCSYSWRVRMRRLSMKRYGDRSVGRTLRHHLASIGFFDCRGLKGAARGLAPFFFSLCRGVAAIVDWPPTGRRFHGNGTNSHRVSLDFPGFQRDGYGFHGFRPVLWGLYWVLPGFLVSPVFYWVVTKFVFGSLGFQRGILEFLLGFNVFWTGFH